MGGCVSEDALLSHTEEYDRNILEETKESLLIALEEARVLRKEIYGESIGTRGNDVDLKIEPIVKYQTRTEGDTLYYIVNYGDKDGYAVLTTIPGQEMVHAISNEGSLHIADTVENKGLAAFFGNLEANIMSVTYPVVTPDTTIHDFQPFVRNEKTEHLPPLLEANVRYWHQDSPYNMMCPDFLTSPKKVGCMALSAAQIMSYYEWPNKISDVDINWSSAKTTESIAIYTILQRLGSSEYFNLDYYVLCQNIDGTTCYGTFGYEKDVIPTFRKLKYKTLAPATYFSESLAKKDLDNSGPLLVYSENYLYPSGHAWVIDGYINKYKELWEKKEDGSGEYYWHPYDSYLFHCVWGEKEIGNGYFRWNSQGKYIGGDKAESVAIDDRKGPGAKVRNVHYYTGFERDE